MKNKIRWDKAWGIYRWVSGSCINFNNVLINEIKVKHPLLGVLILHKSFILSTVNSSKFGI